MQPFLAASSFLLELYVCICDCRGRVSKQQSPLILANKGELSACPGGACIGIVSMVGLPLPWLFCSSICRGKLSSQNPSGNAYFLTAGNTAGKISLVRITATYFGLENFLYG